MLLGPRVIYKGFPKLKDQKGHLQCMLNVHIPKALLRGISDNGGWNPSASAVKN